MTLLSVVQQEHVKVLKAGECIRIMHSAESFKDLEDYITKISKYLCSDYKGINKTDFVQEEFGYIGLMQIARSLTNVGIHYPKKKIQLIQLQKEVIRRFLNPKTSPYKEKDIMEVPDLGDHNGYLYNLNIALASYQKLSGSKEYINMQQKISVHLYTKIINSKESHIKESPNDNNMVIAHTAAAIYSLFLNDSQNGTNYTNATKSKWMKYLTQNCLNRKYRLPYSSVYGKDKEIPRGSYTALLIYYVSKFEKRFADILYANFKHFFKKDILIGFGIREWPDDVDREDDPIAGATYLDIGISATAYTMATSKSLNDQKTFEAIRDVHNTAKNTFNYFGDAKIQELIKTIFASSILLSSESELPWD